jgi:hypothetical protein
MTTPREVTSSDAPIEMSNDEASAWAQGYNAALTATTDDAPAQARG